MCPIDLLFSQLHVTGTFPNAMFFWVFTLTTKFVAIPLLIGVTSFTIKLLLTFA